MTNMFLKFEEPELKGECTDSRHAGQIEVLSWSHGFSQPTSRTRSSAGGGTVALAEHSDFSFTKYTDSSTDDLLKYCWNGKTIKKATFTAYRASGENEPVKYLEILLETVVIASVSLAGADGDISTETVALSYGKITFNYIPQKKAEGTADTKEAVSYDLKLKDVA